MKKFIICCLVAVALAAAALPPLLEKQVEQLTLASLKAWDSPKPAAAEAVGFSFWQRTLTVKNLTFAQANPQGNIEYRVADVTVQVPLSLLWDGARLWAGQSLSGRVPVAESFTLRDMTSSNTQMKAHFASGHGSRIAMESAVLGQLLQGAKPQEKAQPWKQFSIDEVVLEGITVDTFNAAGSKAPADSKAEAPYVSLSAARYALRGWDGAVLNTVRVEDATVSDAGQKILTLKAMQYKGLKAPSDELYARALRLNNNTSEDEALAFCKDFFLQATPFIDSFTLEGLQIHDPLLPLQIANVTFDWRATTPWDSTFTMRGFSLPASVPAAAWRLRLPKLNKVEGGCELTVTGLGGDVFREKLSLTSPTLADVNCEIMQTWNGQLSADTIAADFMRMLLNDAKIHVADHGALAYIAGNLSNGNAEALPLLLRNVEGMLQELGHSAEAAELRDNILKFIKNPATLDLSLRKKPLGMMDFIMNAQNPAALVQLSVTTGSTTLENQMRSLFTKE